MNPRRTAAPPAISLFPITPERALRFLLFPVRYWNWKSAVMSVIIRSLAYLCVVARHGYGTGLRAAAIEAMYVALTAGFFSALQQGALRLRPRAVAALVVVAVVPLLAQLCDFCVQHAAGTPNAKDASMGLGFWALLSAAFHLHMMRNGAMIVGDEARSLRHDFQRVPWLVATFVAAPFALVIRAVRRRRAGRAAGEQHGPSVGSPAGGRGLGEEAAA